MAKKRDFDDRDKVEGVVQIVSALLVLFTAMLDPIVSAIIAVALLFIFGVYDLIKKRRKS